MTNHQNITQTTESGLGFSAWAEVLNNLEVGVTVISPELKIVYINDTYRNIVDIPLSISVGNTAFDLYHYTASRGDYGDGDPVELANERLKAFSAGEWSNFVHKMKNGRINKIRREVVSDGFVVTTITDISDITSKENEVSEKEALMTSVLEATNQGIMIVNSGTCGTIELCNIACIEMFGILTEEEKGEISYFDYISKAWKDGKLAAEGDKKLDDEAFLANTLKISEKAENGGTTIRLADDKYIRFDSNAIDGNRRIFTFTDITDSKIREIVIEKARKDSNALLTDFDTAINNMDVGLVLLDSQLNTLIVNEAFHEIWNTSQESFIDGCNFRALMDINRSNGIYDVEDDEWETYVQERLAELKSGEITPRELVRADGKTLIYSCIPLTNGQCLVRYSDISEFKGREADLDKAHREAEHTAADFSAAINNMDVGLVLLDSQLNTLLINDAFHAIWSTTSENFSVGCKFRELMDINRDNGIYDVKDEDWEDYIQERLAELRMGDIKPREFTRADGKTLIYSCIPMTNGQRLVRYSDVSEFKARESNLKEAQLLAESADRSKSEFLANMSHEIRTPMNGVMGMAELLGKTDLTTKQQMFTNVILNSSTALLTIINDILDFSKIEAGKLELDPAPFSISEAIEDVATLVSSAVNEKNLELIVRVQPGLADDVIGDAGRYRQILTNLLGNAVKFTEKGHVLVDVSGTECSGAVSLKCSIQDTGIGIPEDQVKNVFDKFSQVDGSSTRRHEGTGLGLAITTKLVELMDGEVGCTSVMGEGSTFWFTAELPIDTNAVKKKIMPVDISGARILAIDDNAVNRSILLEQFEAWRLNGEAAESGLEGLAMLRQKAREDKPYEAIVLDYHMPDMNGVDVARVIRSDAVLKDTTIIMLTSVDNISESAEFKALNIDGHLTKPARASQLLEEIIDCLRRTRMAGEVPENMNEDVEITNNEDDLQQPVNASALPEGIAQDESRTSAATIQQSPVEPAEPAIHEEPAAQTVFATVDTATTSVETEPPNASENSAQPGDYILVVEDNEVNQMVFTQILEYQNLDFKIVGNGQLAVDEVKRTHPKLLLMDVSMPVMNGVEATKEIRSMFSADDTIQAYRPIIIGVTAHALKDDREMCIAAGMDDYMSKPISPDMLINKISEWLPDLALSKNETGNKGKTRFGQ